MVSSGSRAKASCSLVMRVVCSGPAITVAGVAGIADISLASVVWVLSVVSMEYGTVR